MQNIYLDNFWADVGSSSWQGNAHSCSTKPQNEGYTMYSIHLIDILWSKWASLVDAAWILGPYKERS